MQASPKESTNKGSLHHHHNHNNNNELNGGTSIATGGLRAKVMGKGIEWSFKPTLGYAGIAKDCDKLHHRCS